MLLLERQFLKFAQSSAIIFRENNYSIKIINDYSDFVASCKLRHQVFCDELGWVSGNERGLETDHYDEKAVPFGLFDHTGRLVAYIRLLSADNTFMLEKDFSMLVSKDHEIRKSRDTAETSRVCVAPDHRNRTVTANNSTVDISMLLFKGVYVWCRERSIRYIYTVVELKMLRYLRTKGFPCTLIGKPKTMPDGTRAAAVLMDWREFEIMNQVKRPELLNWFSQEKLSLCLSQ